MKKIIPTSKRPAALDLGRWMGRREAFALVAGRCSAAAVESLRRIRDQKQYADIGRSWDEFCAKELHVSRRTVERLIGYLEEFGPEFFHLSQLTHVTPAEYRAIAPHVTAEGVRLDGAPIALIPENSAQVAEAVKELLQRETSAAREKEAPSIDALLDRFTAAVDALCAHDEPIADEAQLERLAEGASRVVAQCARQGMRVNLA